MKKVIFISVGFCLTLLISSFVIKNSMQQKWCVQVMKNGKKWGVTVMALNMSEAREVAKRIYPDCNIMQSPTQGACK